MSHLIILVFYLFRVSRAALEVIVPGIPRALDAFMDHSYIEVPLSHFTVELLVLTIPTKKSIKFWIEEIDTLVVKPGTFDQALKDWRERKLIELQVKPLPKGLIASFSLLGVENEFTRRIDVDERTRIVTNPMHLISHISFRRAHFEHHQSDRAMVIELSKTAKSHEPSSQGFLCILVPSTQRYPYTYLSRFELYFDMKALAHNPDLDVWDSRDNTVRINQENLLAGIDIPDTGDFHRCDPPPGFVLELYEYQKKTLRWMLQIEQRRDQDPLDGQDFFRIPWNNSIVDLKKGQTQSGTPRFPSFSCTGGILADDPGKIII